MFERLINILHVLVYSECKCQHCSRACAASKKHLHVLFFKTFLSMNFSVIEKKSLPLFFFLEEIWFEEMLYQSSGPIFHLDTSHLQDSTLYKKTYKTCFKNVIFSSQDPPFLIKKAWFLMINNSFIRSQRWLHLQMFRLFSIIFFLKPGTMQLRMSKT